METITFAYGNLKPRGSRELKWLSTLVGACPDKAGIEQSGQGASHQNRDAFPTAKGPKNREMGGLKFTRTEPTAILLERCFHLLLKAILLELRQLWSEQVK